MENIDQRPAIKTPASLRGPLRTTPSRLSALGGSAAVLSASMLTLASVPVLAQDGQSEDVTLKKLTVEESVARDANPYANPSAPYKVERMSSPKHTQPIAETPQTITVISKEVIEDMGATDLADVMRTLPGVTLGTGEGGNAFGDRFIIRGFEARNDVFVNGLRDPGVTTRETFAVEQIEVSKGPSSSFAGRGTTGGAVNLVTKAAGFDDFGKIEVGFGTDSKERHTFDGNLALSDELAVRLNLLYADRDLPDRGWASELHKGAALAVRWEPTEQLTVSADYYHQTANDVPDGGVPWDAITGEPVGREFYGQRGRDYWDTSSDIGTVTVEYAFTDSMRLSNQTRHGKTTNEYVISINGLTYPGAPRGAVVGLATPDVYAQASSQTRDQENTFTANQTNLMIDFETGGWQHAFVAGAEFTKEEVYNWPYSDSQRSVNAGDPLNPNNYAWLQQGGTLERRYVTDDNGNFLLTPSGDRIKSTTEVELETWSVYLLDTVTLSDALEVFAGLRYDNFDYTLDSASTAYTDETAQSYDEGFVNGHAGVVYSPWENGNVYLTFSTSTNPTGEQLDAGSNCAYGGLCSTDVDPEEATNWELGTKWELLEGDLLATAAIFQIDKDNVLTSTGGRGTPIVVEQVGELQVRGIELGLSGNVTEALSLFAGVTLLDTEISNAADPSEEGEEFPNTAEESATILARYQITDAFAVGTTVTYTGEIRGGTPSQAGNDNAIDSNVRYDLMAEWQMNEAVTARLNMLNVTDEEYYDALYRSGAPFTYVGEGRSTTLTVSYEF